MEGIQVSVEKTGSKGDIAVIKVGGYIDTTTSAELERALDSVLKDGLVKIIIQLNNVDYISSAGWGIFISEIKAIREKGGDLRLVGMIPDVYEVFELLEFNYILKAFDDLDSAVASFGEKTKESGSKKAAARPRSQEQKQPENVKIDDAPEKGVEEKIKTVALDNPGWGPSQISKELNSEKHGFINIGTFSVWKILKKLGIIKKNQRQGMKD